jgi:hypothetical protein
VLVQFECCCPFCGMFRILNAAQVRGSWVLVFASPSLGMARWGQNFARIVWSVRPNSCAK